MITPRNLELYFKLEDEIYSRGREVIEKLGLLYRNFTVDIEVCNDSVNVFTRDRDDDLSDLIKMTHEEFSSDNYLEIAKKILDYQREQKRIQKEEETKKHKQKIHADNKKEYERLKKIFENE